MTLQETIARALATRRGSKVVQKAHKLDAKAALDAIAEAGLCVAPQHATPKMAEAGLFANNDALLMSAGAVDMMNAYQAMIQAGKA